MRGTAGQHSQVSLAPGLQLKQPADWYASFATHPMHQFTPRSSRDFQLTLSGAITLQDLQMKRLQLLEAYERQRLAVRNGCVRWWLRLISSAPGLAAVALGVRTLARDGECSDLVASAGTAYLCLHALPIADFIHCGPLTDHRSCKPKRTASMLSGWLRRRRRRRRRALLTTSAAARSCWRWVSGVGGQGFDADG